MKRYDPSRILFSPEKKLYGYWMKLDNLVGVLEKISKLFASHGINILKAIITSNEEGADAIFYCDFTRSKIEEEDLLSKFRKVREVKDIRLIRPIIDGLLIDDIHFPITVSNERYLLFRERSFRMFVKEMRDELGSAAEAFLYYTGKKIGEETWRELDKYTEDIFSKLEIFKALFKNDGLGVIEMDISDKTSKIRVHDSLECKQGIGSGKRYSHLIRGMLEVLFKEAYAQDVKVIETKCIALGDEYCEFIITRQ